MCFGGYTPVAWSSRNGIASDPSLTSFIFTIKNPHNLPARVFKQRQAREAIYDYDTHGPAFAGNCDLSVRDHCDHAGSCFSALGTGYINDTGIAGAEVLTGAKMFAVKEIEVFELA
jgi:hypothetical protein